MRARIRESLVALVGTRSTASLIALPGENGDAVECVPTNVGPYQRLANAPREPFGMEKTLTRERA